MSDPAELLGIIDTNEKSADIADRASLEAYRRLGNFIEAAAHNRFGLEAHKDGRSLDHGLTVDEAHESAETNYQNALATLDEVIDLRVRGLLARHRVTEARNTLITDELASDVAQHDD